MRILIISHAHPALSNGGSEIAAYQLHKQLSQTPGLSSWFLGCDTHHRHGRPGVSFTQPHDADEYLYQPGIFHGFNFANHDPGFPAGFANLLRQLQPDIIHFHHYIHIGIEAIHIARRVLPQCKIILTIHEYLAICHHHGQMVTPQHTLCTQQSAPSCHRCFPDHPTGDFFLRKAYIQKHFSHVNHFIAPSQFLADRHIAWGLPTDRISIIENLVTSGRLTPNPSKPNNRFLRLGFFGQISVLKGIDVLLDAAALLHARNCPVGIALHGDPSNQPSHVQTHFQQRLATIPPNVTYHGAYMNSDVDRLMINTDAVIVPSVWWENSPVVIQEALRNRRPVLCANLGGMAEKIRHGLDGFHFQHGNAASLAALIEDIAKGRKNLSALQLTMRHPTNADSILAAHLDLYRSQPQMRCPQPGVIAEACG